MSAESLPAGRFRASVLNVVTDRLTARTVAALREAGQRAIVLKAASIREWLYTEDEERSSGDVDLLVPPGVRKEVDAVLEQIGLRYLGPSKVGRARARERLWQEQATGLMVELHESLSGVGVDSSTAWETLSEQTDVMTIGGARAEVLSLPCRTLHLALHAAHHGHVFAKPIDDLERGIVLLPERLWREAATYAQRLEAVPAFVTGLRLASRGDSVVRRLDLGHQAQVIDVALRAGGAPPGAEGLAWLFGVRGWRAKVVFFAQALVPPPSAMRAWLPLARRHVPGLVAVYLWRPLWLARHALPAYAAVRRARRETGEVTGGAEQARQRLGETSPGAVALTWLGLRMAAWAFALPLLKRVVPLRRLVRLMWAGGTGARTPEHERKIVQFSARLPRWRDPRDEANCLERSLLAYRFLAQANANPTLVVAVRREEAGFVGHAWAAVDGRPVHESEAAVHGFARLVEFGGKGQPLGDSPAPEALPDQWE